MYKSCNSIIFLVYLSSPSIHRAVNFPRATAGSAESGSHTSYRYRAPLVVPRSEITKSPPTRHASGRKLLDSGRPMHRCARASVSLSNRTARESKSSAFAPDGRNAGLSPPVFPLPPRLFRLFFSCFSRARARSRETHMLISRRAMIFARLWLSSKKNYGTGRAIYINIAPRKWRICVANRETYDAILLF